MKTYTEKYSKEFIVKGGPEGYQSLCKTLENSKNKHMSNLKSMETRQTERMLELIEKKLSFDHKLEKQSQVRVRLKQSNH